MRGALTGLLLAAGSSSRFGSNKLTARLPGGERVGLAAAGRIAGAVDILLVVTRAGNGATAECFTEAGYDVVECVDADRGMAHSLRCGVRRSMDAAGWLVALADMPHLGSATLTAAVDRFHDTDRIVVPRYGLRPGHPVIFPARFRARLLALTGDEGARSILESSFGEVEWLETDDPGVLRDIDRPSDLGASAIPGNES